MVRDLLDFLRGTNRLNLLFALIAVTLTGAILLAFFVENRWGYPKPPPALVYVGQPWAEGRTRDDAVARQRVEMAALKEEVGINRLRIAQADLTMSRTEAERAVVRRRLEDARRLAADGRAEREALVRMATPERRAELAAIKPEPGSPAN